MTPASRTLLLAIALTLSGGLTATQAQTAVEVVESPLSRTNLVKGVKVLRESGGRLSWSRQNLIAFDMLGADGFYDVHVMRPDGSAQTCLTCDKKGLVPQRHNGQPEWHPSGKYIVFQAEKESHPGSHHQATPGLGRHSDLWLMTHDGKSFFQLTHGPATRDHGVLHPRFSGDGKKLSWSEMYMRPNSFVKKQAGGAWKLKVADFTMGSKGPQLRNIREYEPGGPALYENHGLSWNGDRILFSSGFAGTRLLEVNAIDIYSMDLPDDKPIRLAHEGYNEHAQLSPNGRKIAWMTSAGNRNRGTDYWLMDVDGANKARLTRFNEPLRPGAQRRFLVCADSSWSPDGKYLAAYVFTDLIRQQGMIMRIELSDEVARSATR